MRRILALALGFAAVTGCDYYESSYEQWTTYDDGYGAPMQFARGDSLQDQATFWGDTRGFALGNDRYGAVGMVGMVCSFGTQDGYLRIDMDPDDGDELVLDAVATPLGGFATISVDGAQMTITEFPSEWEGQIAVDVVADDAPDDAALTDDQIVVVHRGDESCTVQRLDRDTAALQSEVTLDAPCRSRPETDPATGVVYLSTTAGTFAIAPDGGLVAMGGPADVLAWDGDLELLVKGEADTRTVSAFDTEPRWSTTLDGGELLSVDFVARERVVVGLSGLMQGALVVLDARTGDLLEDVRTEAAFRSVRVSPEGGMLAVRSATALHLVRVE